MRLWSRWGQGHVLTAEGAWALLLRTRGTRGRRRNKRQRGVTGHTGKRGVDPWWFRRTWRARVWEWKVCVANVR